MDTSTMLRLKSQEKQSNQKTVRLIYSTNPQPRIKVGLTIEVKEQLLKEEQMHGPGNSKSTATINPLFFELDLRKENKEDYPRGFLSVLKQIDVVNHAVFKLGEDVWGDWEYIKDDEILCALVDSADCGAVTGFVAIELRSGAIEIGNLLENNLMEKGTLTITMENPIRNTKTYAQDDFTAIWKTKLLVSRKVW